MKERVKFWIFWALMFVGAVLVLCQRGYSDGDDAFFYRYAQEMGLFEYLGWRYETWVGRMGGEAMVWLTFRIGLPFWRVVNALMLVLLPMGILRLAGWTAAGGDCVRGEYRAMGLPAAVTAVAGYFLMNFMTLGYAAVWVNGSIFYTWSFTCGIWALVPFAELVSGDAVWAERPEEHEGERRRWGLQFLYAVPCAVIAAMSVEQMGAVLVVFETLAVLYVLWKRRRLHVLPTVQTVLTIVAFSALFLAPGNELRVASEIAHWMPEYETMSFGQHLFITLHWMISSFANENKLFLCGIWIAGIALLLQRRCAERGLREGAAGNAEDQALRPKPAGRWRRAADWSCIGIAAVFTAAALLPFAGITALSDLGMQYVGVASRIEMVPSLANMDGARLFAIGWWVAALIFTLVFVWRSSGHGIVTALAYLAGIASEAIMFFSPTMYASGARVYYLTDLLYLFVLLALSFGIRKRGWRNAVYGAVLLTAAWNFVSQIGDFLLWM